MTSRSGPSGLRHSSKPEPTAAPTAKCFQLRLELEDCFFSETGTPPTRVELMEVLDLLVDAVMADDIDVREMSSPCYPATAEPDDLISSNAPGDVTYAEAFDRAGLSMPPPLAPASTKVKTKRKR